MCLFQHGSQEQSVEGGVHQHQTNYEEIGMRALGIGIAAAITLAAAVAPANAQGLWIGAPGFGVGIGVGPSPYYAGYWGGPYWGAGYGYYGYEPSYAYQSYAYEPAYDYDSYAYLPDDGYAAYAYGPRLRTYGYESGYGYAPRVRYSRNYSDSPGVRATRSYSYADTRGVIKRDRGHRSGTVHNTRLQDRAVMRNGFAIGAERESAGSRPIRPQASKALARGPAQDLRQSKRIEAGKTGKGRVRTQTY